MNKIKNNFRFTIILATILIASMFTACVSDPVTSVQNGNYKVEFLFEQNGCKMYRFQDGTRYIYWTDCQGKVSYDYNRSTGKSTTTEHGETITSN